mmetsp:Transcript_147289/g.473158  ORF Transcript_147289/g.473158 Transcript_147289/m.473158 type:complete len:394 (-) Transcript_147289:4-1185(-)
MANDIASRFRGHPSGPPCQLQRQRRDGILELAQAPQRRTSAKCIVARATSFASAALSSRTSTPTSAGSERLVAARTAARVRRLLSRGIAYPPQGLEQVAFPALGRQVVPKRVLELRAKIGQARGERLDAAAELRAQVRERFVEILPEALRHGPQSKGGAGSGKRRSCNLGRRWQTRSELQRIQPLLALGHALLHRFAIRLRDVAFLGQRFQPPDQTRGESIGRASAGHSDVAATRASRAWGRPRGRQHQRRGRGGRRRHRQGPSADDVVEALVEATALGEQPRGEGVDAAVQLVEAGLRESACEASSELRLQNLHARAEAGDAISTEALATGTAERVPQLVQTCRQALHALVQRPQLTLGADQAVPQGFDVHRTRPSVLSPATTRLGTEPRAS